MRSSLGLFVAAHAMFRSFHIESPAPLGHLDDGLRLLLAVVFGAHVPMQPAPSALRSALHWCAGLRMLPAFARKLRHWDLTMQSRIPEDVRRSLERVHAGEVAAEETRCLLMQVAEAANVDVVLLPGRVLARPQEATVAGWGLLVDGDAEVRIIPSLARAGLRPLGTERDGSFALETAGGVGVSLCARLPWVRMTAGGPFVDLAGLKRCGQLEPLRVQEGRGVWSLSRPVRTAQLVADALIHYRRDSRFGALQALFDACELGWHVDEELAFDAFVLVQTDMEHAEAEAFRELGRALAGGTVNDLSPRAGGLLNHAVATAASRPYRLRLAAQQAVYQWQWDGHLDELAEKAGKIKERVQHLRRS